MSHELKIGDMAPSFTAVTDSSETVRLEDFRGKKVVLYFYPKDDPRLHHAVLRLSRPVPADRGEERGGAGRQP